ncbi:MAG: hypothetical protein J1E60_06030 [Christensenellaceae bacterium]|nr:hypothetical protein [Christensenellaceae bacterium]
MNSARSIKPVALFLAFAISLALLACTNVTPRLEPGITPAPIGSVSPSLTEMPKETPDAFASHGEIGTVDALGSIIRDAEHFQQYLQFNSIRVYEEDGDTFVDCSVINSYPELIVCAVAIRFFDENGDEIASSSLQMPDGSFMLSLENGETPLYARILSDITLTDKSFELVFDPSVEVKPHF